MPIMVADPLPARTPRPLRRWLPVAGLLAAWCAYAGAYVWSTSFVVDGERHFVLFDDLMISMRYAHHLAEGHGLVWNVGEPPVEGFTNPLWTLYMAGVHLLPIPLSKTSLAIQVSGMAFLLLTLLLVYRTAIELFENRVAAWVAALLTGFYFPLLNWCGQGTEVSMLAFLYSWAILRTVRAMRTDTFDPWVHLLLGIATWVRLDMIVGLIVVEGFLLAGIPGQRTRNARWAAATAVVFLGGQTLARLWYFGDLLPNTYYLKLTGYPLVPRLARGVDMFVDFVRGMNGVLFVMPFAILAFRRDRAVLLLIAAFLAQAAYSMWVGGDAWENTGGSNRYISVAMPAFMTLLAGSLAALLGRLFARSQHAARGGTVALALLALLIFNNLSGDFRYRRMLLQEWPWFGAPRDSMVRAARVICRITEPDARVAVVCAGTLPYFCDRPVVDLLGKSDRRIARGPMHRIPSGRGLIFFPGHLKWDYAYSLGELKPDVVVELWTANPHAEPTDAWPHLRDYQPFELDDRSSYLRTGSPRIRWGEVAARAQAAPR